MQPLNFQPIPYQGSKRQLAPRICRLFPQKVKTLYEPFAGSAAVTLYAASHRLAERFVIGDVFPELIDLWQLIIERPGQAASQYRALWNAQFIDGFGHFNAMRSDYNLNKDPVVLLYLIARCVKNAVRFNKSGHFTQSVDKRRTGVHPDKLENTMHNVSSLLKGRTTLFCGDFRACISKAEADDLVYMDPPYQGTTYGADKRYVAQLERDHLIESIQWLNLNYVPFILSYDGTTGDKIYAEPLPASLNAVHLQIHAGRSSQATLAGRKEDTIESLYVSGLLANSHDALPDYSLSPKLQTELFA